MKEEVIKIIRQWDEVANNLKGILNDFTIQREISINTKSRIEAIKHCSSDLKEIIGVFPIYYRGYNIGIAEKCSRSKYTAILEEYTGCEVCFDSQNVDGCKSQIDEFLN